MRSIIEPSAAEAVFKQSGALVLEHAFPVEVVERLHAELRERYLESNEQPAEEICRPVGERREMVTVAVDPPFSDPAVYANPLVLPILKRLLGDHCRLASFVAVCSFPGAPAQPIHRDFPFLFESAELSAAVPSYAITLVVPLVQLSEETGTTALWEGSHKWLHVTPESVKEGRARLPYPAVGGCYLMDYRLLHRGTANRSRQPRPILYLVYSRPWFIDILNFPGRRPLILGPGVLASVPPEHRHLFAGAE